MKKLILSLALLLASSIVAMEQDFDKLPSKLKDIIIKSKIFEEEVGLPRELIAQVLSKLVESEKATGIEGLKKSITAINSLRLVNKNLNKIINSNHFIDSMIEYWTKKYNVPVSTILLKWAIPGVDDWIKVQPIYLLSKINQDIHKSFIEKEELTDAEEKRHGDLIKLILSTLPKEEQERITKEVREVTKEN